MAHRALFAAPPLLLALFLSGCASLGPPDDEVPDGYVLLDRDARKTISLEVDGWEGAPILPVATPARSKFTLNVLGGRTIDLIAEPGVLAHVHADAVVELVELGSEIRSDRLLLHGSELAVRDVALLVGGSIAARGDGLWNLTTPDIFLKASHLEESDGLIEALPDTAIDTGDVEIDAAGPSSIIGLDPDAASDDPDSAAPGRREALFVGVYTSAASTLLLDASGRYSLTDRCTGKTAREGHYYVSGGRVVLQSKGEPPIAYAADIDTLMPPSGDRLRAFEPSWALAAPGELQ